MSQSTFWSEEPPASPSASQDSERAWMTRVVTWPSSFLQFLIECAPGGWSGRTSLASVPRTKAGALLPSSVGFHNSGMGGPTEAWTLNTSDWPSDASVCSLSDILETGDVPQRYFLSAKACRGILRRAAKRGKELPPALKLALEEAAGITSTLAAG